MTSAVIDSLFFGSYFRSPRYRRALHQRVREALQKCREGDIDYGYTLWRHLDLYKDRAFVERFFGVSDDEVYMYLVECLRFWVAQARRANNGLEGSGILDDLEVVRKCLRDGVVTQEDLGFRPKDLVVLSNRIKNLINHNYETVLPWLRRPMQYFVRQCRKEFPYIERLVLSIHNNSTYAIFVTGILKPGYTCDSIKEDLKALKELFDEVKRKAKQSSDGRAGFVSIAFGNPSELRALGMLKDLREAGYHLVTYEVD